MADRRAEADDFDDDRPSRPKGRVPANAKVIVLVGLGVGLMGVTALVGLAVVGFGLAAVLSRAPVPPPVPVVAAPPMVAVPVPTAVGTAPDVPPKEPVATLLPDNDPAADLYAPAAEEGVLSADGHASSPLRPRKDDTVFKLDKLRSERAGMSPFAQMALDYERTRDGSLGGNLYLVLRVNG